MDDRLFGFRELAGGGDARFWLDHRPSRQVAHEFRIQPENAKRRRSADGFAGIVHVKECIAVEVRCQKYEVLYRQDHDIWYTGSSFICGSHGQSCPAIDAVKYWLQTGHHMLIHYPRMTWDGRVWLGGLATHSGQQELKEKLQ